jgi:hypothetical protein
MTTPTVTRRPFTLPRVLLHVEGGAVLAAATWLYFSQGLPLWAFLLFLLAPDLSAAGYLFGTRAGSVAYNLAHTTVWPILLGLLAWQLDWTWALPVALIWLAHIGMDRMVGYGLKYPDRFNHTHFDEV